MSIDHLLHTLWRDWPWWLAGELIGLSLVPLARAIPRAVLQRAQAPPHEWQGPGGGLDRPVPIARYIWVLLVNTGLWIDAARIASHPAWAAPLLWGIMASALLLLALIDWDTTLLPDWIVLPLGMAGLASSHVGLTPHSLFASAASAATVLGLFGGLGLVFRRVRGKSGVGGGDLKLLAALATWWGVVDVLYVVSLASLGTVVWNLAWRRFKNFDSDAEWPFGPAIVAAALLWGV